MRRFTRLALAALAAIGASGALVAAPAASWVNFGGGINNDDGTIKYYGGNTAYYITVSGGTRAADGSYIQVGTPAVAATEETQAVAATPGSVQLTFPGAFGSGKRFTIIADVEAASFVDVSSDRADLSRVLEVTLNGGAVVSVRPISDDTNGTRMQTHWYSGSGSESGRNFKLPWTPANRQILAFTYKGDSNATDKGFTMYRQESDAEMASVADSGLFSGTSEITSIVFGKNATGMKIYGFYVYETNLANASAVTTEIAANKAALAVPLSFAFSRAGLTADGNTMEVLQVGGGAAKASTFTATLGTNATRVTEGSETEATAFFKSVTSGSTLLTTNGYPMVQSKFATSGSKNNEGWSIYLPFTPSAETTVTRVCPQLFAVNASGNVQTDPKVFNYTVTLYSGSVDATTESPTALDTATGTTISLSGTTVNTQAAAFDSALTLNAGAPYTMKLAVSDRNTGGGSYSGIAGVVFSSAIVRTVSGEGTWSANWPAGSAPADGSAVELTVSDAATLSMDAAASLSSLTVNDGSDDSSASLTFSGEQSLTSSATILNVDTDVSAITASLGVVTLASNKTLTTKSASDFSSITAGSGATVKYTAPSGSIAKVDNATVELAAGENSINGITLPSAGGTYKVSSGTYTGMTLTFTGTATNYAFTGGDMTFNGEFSFGTATATISGGTIRAPKMVTVQGGNSRPTSVTQTGGNIILSGTTDGSSTTRAVVMFGHWRYATSTYNLSGGSIKAEQGGMRFGNDSPSTLNLSGTGLLKVKGIWGNGTTDCALNLSGGTLSIGSDGFQSINRLTVTATGGELNAFASNTIAQAIALNGPTTFSAAAGFEMTVQGTLSGSGALTIGTETATGTVVLGTQRPTIGGIADGATVKLTATEAELANCAITFSTTMGTAPAKERFTVVKPDGTTVLTLTAEPTVTDGTLTVPLPHTGGVITATGNWSEAGVSEESVVYVRGGESAESAITVTLDATLSNYTQIVVIGHVKFVTTTTQATLPTTIVLESGSVLTATASFSGNYTIPSGATVVLDGTTAFTSSSALTVNGALKTQGTVTLSGANAVSAGGTLTVETGTLTLTASDRSLAGTVNIAAGATLVNMTGDALNYDGSPVVNVRGTLDMGETRWTVGSANTLNVYAGATITGVGDEHGALDFYNVATHTLNVPNEGDASQPVTISAKLRLRQSGVTLKFNIALGNAKVNLTGIVRDVGSLEKAGSGSSRLVLSGENKVYTGATTVSAGYLDLVGGCTLATSGVTVANNAAVTFQADESTTATTYTTSFALTGRMDKEGAHSVILSGAITGAGAVNVKNGGLTLDASAATAESPRAVANPITVGLDSGTSGTLTAKGYLTLSNSSNTVKATGTLAIASGTTVLTTANNARGIKGKLAIASGATLKCGIDDAPDYDGSPSFEIAGTLEITGTARWSIPSEATFTLHSGALLKGTGPASGSNYAFDFFGGAAITADGDATIEANVGSHISNKTLTITQSAGTTTISGEVRNSLGLSVAGSGTVVYAPAESVTATTSPLVVDTGATLKLLPAAAFTLNGTVTGAGTLVIGDGSAATTVTLATAGNGTDVTVSPKATLTVATGAGEADSNKSFADGKTVTNNGTLKLTSGYGYFKIAGTGKTVVPGSDFLFGIGGANGDGPFSNGLEVPASANFRIRPWNDAQTIVAKGTAAVNGSITKDGGNNTVTLQIAAGTTLAGSSTFSIPVTFANDTTAKMDSNATFTFSSALTVPKNVTLPGTVTLAEGATLSGAGELSGTVTLGNGVIIDATESTVSGYLKLTGETVTLGDTLKVKASKLTNVLDVPTSAGLDLAKVSLTDDSTIPTGAKLMTSVISSITTLKFFVPPSVPTAPAESPRDSGVDTQIAQAAETYAGWGMIISEVTAITGTGTDGKSTREINGSSLFENVLTLTPASVKDDGTYTATATVAYDFGVAEMTIKSLQLEDDDAATMYVLLAAKVQNSTSSNTASFASGTKLTVLNGETELTPKSVSAADATGVADAEETAGVQWLAVPLATLFPDGTGTRPLKVKASNAAAAN